jgi:hypothetical protein
MLNNLSLYLKMVKKDLVYAHLRTAQISAMMGVVLDNHSIELKGGQKK